MVDYFPLIARAVAALDANTREQRHVLYDRARKTLVDKLRVSDPTLAQTDLGAERAALEAAIQRVERDAVRQTVPQPNPAHEIYDAPARDYPDRPPLKDSRLWGRLIAGVFAALLIIVMGAAISFWPRLLSSVRSTPSKPALAETTDLSNSKTNYVHLRQLVFYRTNQPVGTIIVDKTQTFLYVVRPNVSALRYSIGVGAECITLTGLYHVVRKEERPGGNQAVQQSVDITSDPAKNPLGARVLYLNDNYRIHGSYASATSDRIAREGCIRLLNDDVIYLYDHTPLENRVLVSN
ncbi:MAG: L,D-transpeptidase family protein [Pseudolabrys sp.]